MKIRKILAKLLSLQYSLTFYFVRFWVHISIFASALSNKKKIFVQTFIICGSLCLRIMAYKIKKITL